MRTRALLLAVVAATFLVYSPAWNGAMLWDDDGHITRRDLRSTEGLGRIWFEPGATQQYYPMVHSAFWASHRLWGDRMLGYHLLNIALHALSALLLFLILQRLAIPGALLAVVIFALHPVHVESVAWVTELKNVLSGAFYLAAALAYLAYTGISADGSSHARRFRYLLALFLFILAVLTKSVTVTLPAALLVVCWWQRGRIRWREDVRPLIPFLVIGLVAGLTTVWVERTFIGAQGADFDLTLVQRLLLAGRVVWFHLSKLLWPVNLTFIYPRWTIDPASSVQWLYPVALAAAAAAGWRIRQRSRSPLAALLFFVVTLFPALGFFNVYPFRFSYVADHFQYLASIGPIVLLSVGIAVVVRRATTRRLAHGGAAVLIAAGLGSLTYAQARHYASAEALYGATIERNPSAWLARNNLAAILLAGDPPAERVREAMVHLEQAIRLKPDYAEAHFNLGTAFEREQRLNDAAERYQLVLRLQPGERRALERLAVLRHDRASQLLQQGLGLENAGRTQEAERAYREAAALDPGRAIVRRSFGRTLHRLGEREAAVTEYRASLDLDPSSSETHNDLGVVLAELGRMEEAAQAFEFAVRLDPSDEGARDNLARARGALGRR